MESGLNELISVITNTGVTAVVLAFFIYRDLKWTSTLQETLDKLVATTQSLDDILKGVLKNR